MIEERKTYAKIPVYRNMGPLPDILTPLVFLFNPEKLFTGLRKLKSEVFCMKMLKDPWYFVTGKDGLSFYGQLTSREIDVFEFRQRMFTLQLPGAEMPTDILNVSRATNENLKNFFDKIDQYEFTEIFVSAINRYLNEHLPSEGTIDSIGEFMVGLSTAVIAGTFFGKELYETLPKNLSSYYFAIDESLIISRLVFTFLSTKSAEELAQKKQELVQIYLQALNYRKSHPEGSERPNVFDGYLDIQKKFNLSDLNLIWVYNAMQWSSIHYPAVHGALTGVDILSRPELLVALQNEQTQFDVLDWDAVKNMQILEGAVRENIRLNPISALPRRVVKDLKYKNYLFPKGSVICISPYYEHQNPNVYINPAQFNPYRWTKNKEDAVYASFVPGGLGHFGCLGMNFAIHFIITMWAVLLRNYEFSFVKGVPKIKMNFLPVVPHEPIPLHYRRRSRD